MQHRGRSPRGPASRARWAGGTSTGLSHPARTFVPMTPFEGGPVAAGGTMPRLPGLADDADGRKARGAFFTPAPVSEFLAAWALRSPLDRVLEPSCGEAVFLLAAARRLGQLAEASPSPEQLVGLDVHPPSIEAAERLLSRAGIRARLEVGDFLERSADPGYDAVIGNPPFVRYQGFTDRARTAGQRAALAQGVRLSGLASSWASFVVHAAAHLTPGGRLAMVLPGELLSRDYAAPVRRFLLDRFADVRVVVFAQRVFPDVSEEVVLVLAEGTGGSSEVGLHLVDRQHDLGRLLPLPTPHHRSSVAAARWSAALVAPAALELYERPPSLGAFVPLGAWGRPKLGVVTGANRFFAMTAAEVASAGLRDGEAVPLCPPGSQHLRALTFDREDWSALRTRGARVYLFRPGDDRIGLSAGARRRLGEGERTGVADAYKCRTRRPWWQVPDSEAPDLFVTYMNHRAVQLASNGAGVRCINSVHGLRLATEPALGRELLPLAALCSLTLLSGELVGRAFGGGMLQLLPREAGRLLVPAPRLVAEVDDALRAIKPQVRQMLAAEALDGAIRLVDDVVLPAAGLQAGEIVVLQGAWMELRERRLARSR